jgi:glycosyltransferase involved in cell wall biosynthesis
LIVDGRSEDMRIVIVVRDIKVTSGIYRAVSTYLRSDLPQRVQVEIATFRMPEDICTQELDDLDVPVYVLDDASIASATHQLGRLLRRQDIDLVIGTTWKTYIVAKLASLGTRTKSVAWLHSIPCVIEGMPRTVVFRLLSRRDPIIFASRAVQQKHQFSWHIGEEYIVYNGLEPLPDLHPRGSLAGLGIPEDGFVLGYTAEFKSWKNHKTLLDAFSKLLAVYPKLHLVLIGLGETFSSIVEMARSHDLLDHVHFLERRVDARELLGTFDIYVHPSDGEAFGFAVAEAMAAGLAVVAADAGAFPELIRNERDGLLFSPLDPEELFHCLRRLIDDQNLRHTLGANARRAIYDNFSAAAFSKALTAACEAILMNGPRSSRKLALTTEEDRLNVK